MINIYINISLNNTKVPSNQKSLNGLKSIFAGGFRYEPILQNYSTITTTEASLNLNLDNPQNFKFQTSISDLEKTDFCLFIGTNPRFEASTLNLRFRKIFRKGNTSFAAIGGNFASTYPINFLGLSAKTLLSIAKGTHPIYKTLAQAKKPTIIFGAKVLERFDGEGIQTLLNDLSSNFYKQFQKKLSINLLHTD